LKPSFKSGLTDFQDFEAARLFAAALSFSQRVMHPLQAPQLMRDALAHAMTQRTAVHLAVPEDIQKALLQPEQQLPASGLVPALRAMHAGPASEEEVASAAALLGQRRAHRARMLLAVGHLAVGLGPQVTALAEALNAPMVTRLDAKGIVDEGHPLCLGVVGVHGNPGLEVTRDLVESADLIISCGVEDQMLGQLVLADGMQTKELLLIQPDTSAMSARFSLTAALVGNLEGTLEKLLAAMEMDEEEAKHEEDGQDGGNEGKEGGGEEVSADFPITLSWDHFTGGHWRGPSKSQPYQLPEEVEGRKAEKYCHPVHIYRALNDRLGAADTLAVDVGDQTLWAALLGHLTKGTRTLSDEFMGTMGYSLPAAIAAALLAEGRGTHVAVVGDGALQMTVPELATAVAHRCRVIVVVFVNGSLGRVKHGFGDTAIGGTNLGKVDFVALAAAYGAGSARVTTPSEAEEAVAAAWVAEGPFLLEVATDPELSADMAKMHDMRGLAALAARLGDALPAPLAGLRRPRAMQALLDHARRCRAAAEGDGKGDGDGGLTGEDVEGLRGLLDDWRAEYAGKDGSLDRRPSGFSRFVMQRIHKLEAAECSARCGCWQPTGPDGKPVEISKGRPVEGLDIKSAEDFPGAYPAQLLKSAAGVDVGDGDAFGKHWAAAVAHLFASKPDGRTQWQQFRASGLSAGRSLRWDVMTIAPGQSFPLHAHANVEAIYVAAGELHELRLEGPPPSTHFVDDDEGHPRPPDLSTLDTTFSRSVLPAGSFLVNEVGSVHQSFTGEGERAVLLILWAGCHANIDAKRMPRAAYEAGFRPVELQAASKAA